MQLCQLCTDNEDILVLKVDWDQNKPIARALGVKVSQSHVAIVACNASKCKISNTYIVIIHNPYIPHVTEQPHHACQGCLDSTCHVYQYARFMQGHMLVKTLKRLLLGFANLFVIRQQLLFSSL